MMLHIVRVLERFSESLLRNDWKLETAGGLGNGGCVVGTASMELT